MNRLTPKQERFAQEVARGATLSDAYRIAYDAENMLQTTIWQESSKLMDNPKITERVNALVDARQNQLIASDGKRIRTHVFDRLFIESMDPKSPPAARIKALELLGKSDIVNMFKERVETETKVVTDVAQLEAELRDRLERLGLTNAVDVTPAAPAPQRSREDAVPIIEGKIETKK